MKFAAEYVWLDAKNNFRSKIRTIDTGDQLIPDWNYDGSSTGQADITSSEIILKPCCTFKNPLLKDSNDVNIINIIVLCATYTTDGKPLNNNYYHSAKELFEKQLQEEPWYGLEQEYFMINALNKENTKNDIIGYDSSFMHGIYYCSPLQQHQTCVKISEEHLIACYDAGINISGINAEVAPGQFEFQIGPSEGIHAGNHMMVARYLLEKIAIKYGVHISYDPKLHPRLSGSGCHTNFSTKSMRKDNGLTHIMTAIKRLELNHNNDILNYGVDNNKRLTGACETADINTFSHGIGTRSTSIRIGYDTFNNKKGYFEDRRPAANCDPYLVTSTIFKTCCP
jgi:glutamine synthetase